jgi:hypothetical protein
MSKQVPWDVIPENTGIVLPEQLYKLEIDNMEETASGGGKYMIKGTFKVLEPEAQKGLLYFENFVIGSDDDLGADDPKTWANAVGAKIWKQVIDKAGVPKTGAVDLVCSQAKGQQVLAEIGIEVEQKEGKYKGTERNRARRWYRVGERPVGGAPVSAAAAVGKPATPPPFRPGQV